MKRVIFVLLIQMLLLTSCGIPNTMRLQHYDSSYYDDRLMQILDALQSGNKEMIRSSFSANAIAEAGNFDAQLDALFDFFQGDVQSWVQRGASESNNRHKHIRKSSFNAWYQVDTASKSYLFFIVECTMDTEQPNNIGMQTLRVIHTEDKEALFPSWEEIEIPGIYTPKTD